MGGDGAVVRSFSVFFQAFLGGILLGFALLGGPDSSFAREQVLPNSEFRVGISLGYADSRGAFPVTSVLRGTPADRGGLRVGDCIYPPSGAGNTSESVMAFLSRELEGGFSVLLSGDREGISQTFWLRPYRFSLVQKRLVAYSLSLEEDVLRGQSLWKEGMKAFDSYLYRSLDAKEFESRISALREELLKTSWELRNKEIPSELSLEINANFSVARDAYARAMDLRREGLLYLMDFVIHEKDPLSLQQGRRREAEHKALLARRLECRGGGELLQALRRGSLGEENIRLLLFWERGFERGESDHPREFEVSSLFQEPRQTAVSEEKPEKYAFLRRPPEGMDCFAYWVKEELLVLWSRETPEYLFLWTGVMWYQIAAKDGEPPGEPLLRNRDTLRQQKRQNDFRIFQEELPEIVSLGEEQKLRWMGMLGW